ncbi:MAG: hypothetical protein AAB388_00685 [Patescibacteria group bacterium]
MMKCAKLLVGLLFFLSGADVSYAADLSVRPFLIDREVVGRDYVTETVALTNETDRKLIVFATVNEISVDSDGTIKEFISPIMTDRTNTITSWVEISRGRIELEPRETKTVPLSFRIHPNPVPGEYHAFIGFVPASKRPAAERIAEAGDADGVIVKLSIADKSQEFLRISGFLIDRFVTKDEQRKVAIEVENLGDVPATPVGEIIFFDSAGQEVVAVPVNSEATAIAPGEKHTLESIIPFEDKLGRYKANLSLQYGTKQRATIYDTAQFYMMPFHIMIFILALVVLVSLGLAFLLRRAFREHNEDVEGTSLPMYVRSGHNPNPKHHDIDLSKKI